MGKYKFESREYITKGDLNGYVVGIISFADDDDNETSHDFIFRHHDPKNGKDFKLISIDYGYKNPYIDTVWDDIEKELKSYVLSKI